MTEHTTALFVGFDVSLTETYVRILNDVGTPLFEASVPSDPDALADVLSRDAQAATASPSRQLRQRSAGSFASAASL